MARSLSVRTIVTDSTNTNLVDKTITKSSTAPILIDAEPVAAESETGPINVAVDISKTTMIVLYCTVAATVCTNASIGGSPANTIVLVAGEPYVWHTTSLDTCLVTADITSLYVTVAGAVAGEVTLAAIVDPTP